MYPHVLTLIPPSHHIYYIVLDDQPNLIIDQKVEHYTVDGCSNYFPFTMVHFLLILPVHAS
jgi:hypothetical protein